MDRRDRLASNEPFRARAIIMFVLIITEKEGKKKTIDA